MTQDTFPAFMARYSVQRCPDCKVRTVYFAFDATQVARDYECWRVYRGKVKLSYHYTSERVAQMSLQCIARTAYHRPRKGSPTGRVRDARRVRSYRAEWAANAVVTPPAIPLNPNKTLIETARDFAWDAARSAGLPLAGHLLIRLRPWRRCRYGDADGFGRVNIYGEENLRRSIVILHEYAHVIDKSKEPGHGPTWAGYFVRLCEALPLTAEYGKVLRAGLEAVHGPLPHNPK